MRPSAAGARRPVMLDQPLQRRHKPDYILPVLATTLLVIGLVVVYAISPGLSAQQDLPTNYFVNRQLIAIGLGLVAFLMAANLPLKRWRALLWPLVIAGGLATIVSLITPVTPEYPAHRWIRFGGLSLQSVELVKFALMLGLAYFLTDRIREGQLNDQQRTFKPLLLVLAGLAVIVGVLQKDLGSTGVLAAMVACMIFVAGLPFRRLVVVALLVLGATGLLILSSGYRRDRVLTFLNPQADCQDAGYQACQALIAIGSGGMFGKGLAHSVQAYGYLPEAANDSIFAITAEKFGFVGATVLVGLFAAFFARLKSITERTPDMTTRLVMAGILAWLSTQTLINIGAMVGLLPLKGITLPLVSYGGTSIIFVLAAIGVAFNISRYTTYGVNQLENNQGNQYDNRPDRRRDRRPHHAHTSRRP